MHTSTIVQAQSQRPIQAVLQRSAVALVGLVQVGKEEAIVLVNIEPNVAALLVFPPAM